MTIGLSIIIDQHDDPSSAETQNMSCVETHQEIFVCACARCNLCLRVRNVIYGGCNGYGLLFDNIISQNFDRCPYFSLLYFVASLTQVTRHSGIVPCRVMGCDPTANHNMCNLQQQPQQQSTHQRHQSKLLASTNFMNGCLVGDPAAAALLGRHCSPH